MHRHGTRPGPPGYEYNREKFQLVSSRMTLRKSTTQFWSDTENSEDPENWYYRRSFMRIEPPVPAEAAVRRHQRLHPADTLLPTNRPCKPPHAGIVPTKRRFYIIRKSCSTDATFRHLYSHFLPLGPSPPSEFPILLPCEAPTASERRLRETTWRRGD